MVTRKDPLARYRSKRDFARTPEPSPDEPQAPDRGKAPAKKAARKSTGSATAAAKGVRTRKTESPATAPLAFVIQKHAATRLHYDFRLELDGVMLSWAVPRGPSYDPKDRRMAVQTEDHPISYNRFEGTIPSGQYGAGTVIVWDRGTWTPLNDPHEGLRDGKLLFTLDGQKMAGAWELIRIAKPGERQVAWLLFKKHDAWERPHAEYDVVTALPDSVNASPVPAAQRLQPTPGAPLTVTPPARGTAASRRPRAGPSSRAGDAAEVHGDSGSDRGTGDGPGSAPPALPALVGQLPGAKKARAPAKLSPQLATLAPSVQSLAPGGDWLLEIKLDGYRLMARCDGDRVALITRGGHDWTAKMPGLARELAALGLAGSWLDGEIVVLGDDGLPAFNGLQRAFDEKASEAIVYFVFDLPWCDGHDLRQVPLRERRRWLERLLEDRQGGRLRYSHSFDADPASVLQSADRLGLEGVIAKRGDAPYVSARTETWLKLKCRRRQEFVVGGYTDRGGDTKAAEIGSLVLGVHDDDGNLVSVGSVGSGWDAQAATDLKRRLNKLEATASPFAAPPKRGRWPRRPADSGHWVRPTLVVEVSFSDWTPDRQVRHARYEGVRTDKPAKQVRREEALPGLTAESGGDAPAAGGKARTSTQAGAGRATTRASTARAAASASIAGGTRVTHPERVVDPSTGLTKLDVVRYYESVADWLVPHLKNRPSSLVRGPSGIEGQLFFQKHLDKLRIEDVRSLPRSLWPEHEPLLEVPTPRAVAAAAQMNVLEFHTWNARVTSIGQPDRIVFDIDPGEGTPWKHVQEAASLLHAFLDELRLASWLKTSGGKGLHVVVPLAPRHGWDTVKGFSQAVVQHLSEVLPQRFVAKSGPSNRVGRIFVDYLRNGHGATTAAAFSARARPGMGVSMPVAWEQLDELKSGAHWTIATARDHLSFQAVDPWEDYPRSRQTLARAMKSLGFAPRD